MGINRSKDIPCICKEKDAGSKMCEADEHECSCYNHGSDSCKADEHECSCINYGPNSCKDDYHECCCKNYGPNSCKDDYHECTCIKYGPDSCKHRINKAYIKYRKYRKVHYNNHYCSCNNKKSNPSKCRMFKDNKSKRFNQHHCACRKHGNYRKYCKAKSHHCSCVDTVDSQCKARLIKCKKTNWSSTGSSSDSS